MESLAIAPVSVPELPEPVADKNADISGEFSPVEGVTDPCEAYAALCRDWNDGKPHGRCLTLPELVDAIGETLRNAKGRPLHTIKFIGELLSCVDITSEEWKRYRLFDERKAYTRNLIATDDETFTLILLCWNPGRYSPIHDHPCDGCWVRVVEGAVREVRYGARESDGTLPVIADGTLGAGSTTFMHDSIGLHKVGNPTEVPSVSLHLYAPPFSTCRIWLDPSKPDEVQHPVMTYFSMYGEVVDYGDNARR